MYVYDTYIKTCIYDSDHIVVGVISCHPAPDFLPACMYIYIYIHTYVCIYTYICTYTCIWYIRIYIWQWGCSYWCHRVSSRSRFPACIYVCVYIYTYIYVYTYICTYICIWYTWIYIHDSKDVVINVVVCPLAADLPSLCICINIHIYKYIYTYTHIYSKKNTLSTYVSKSLKIPSKCFTNSNNTRQSQTIPQTEEIGIQIIRNARISTSFHGSLKLKHTNSTCHKLHIWSCEPA